MSHQQRAYLEMTADRIEAILAAHHAPGHITGGTVGPRVIRMYIQPAPHVRYNAIKALADDLALAIRAATLSVQRGKEGVILEFVNPEQQPVGFSVLLNEVQPLPAATALLGMGATGAPLLARISAPEVAHILIAGTTGSGKSVLLRAIATSLALGNAPHDVQLMVIDTKGRLAKPFGGLPHLARPQLVTGPEITEGLRSLVHMMELRDRRGESGHPRIVCAIDELADVVMTVAGAETLITRLLQRGREAGIHLVAATQRPSAAILGGLMRANFPLRIVGRVVSADDARIAAGRAETNAHLLAGRGDFIAVAAGDAPVRFQAPFLQKAEIAQLLNTHETVAPIAALPAPTAEAGHTDVPVEVGETPVAEQVERAVRQLRPNWAALRAQIAAGDVSKSALVREIWGEGKRYAGSHAKWLDKAVALLDADEPVKETIAVDWSALTRMSTVRAA